VIKKNSSTSRPTGRVHAHPGRNPLVKEITFDPSYSQLKLRTTLPQSGGILSVLSDTVCPKDGDTGSVCFLSWPLEALERGLATVRRGNFRFPACATADRSVADSQKRVPIIGIGHSDGLPNSATPASDQRHFTVHNTHDACPYVSHSSNTLEFDIKGFRKIFRPNDDAAIPASGGRDSFKERVSEGFI
jgi:hypothetical protein